MVGLGLKIKKVREIKNFTQEHMAKELGVSQSTYSNYESIESDVTPDLLDQIAKILNVKPEQIEKFDEQIIFNNHNNTANDHASNIMGNYQPTVNNYVIDSEIEQLYKKNISLLEEKVKALEKELGK